MDIELKAVRNKFRDRTEYSVQAVMSEGGKTFDVHAWVFDRKSISSFRSAARSARCFVLGFKSARGLIYRKHEASKRCEQDAVDDMVFKHMYKPLEAERDALAQRLRMIVSHATSGKMTGEGLSINDISCEITRLRNVIFTAGQEVADKDLLAANRDLVAQVAKQEAVVSAAKCIHHWHDAMADSSGMVVSADHVRKLWEALAEYETLKGTDE